MALTPQELTTIRAKAAQGKLDRENAAKAQMQGQPQLPNKQFQQIKTSELITSKTFLSRTPHSRFIFSDNTEATFVFGRMIINEENFPGIFNCPTAQNQQENKNNGRPRWKVYMEELEAICPPKGNNPNIYTQEAMPEELPKPAVNAVDETSLAVAEASIMNTQKVNIEQQTNAPTTSPLGSPDASTIDRELLAAAQNSGASPLGNSGGPITPVDIDKINTGNMADSVS